MGISLVESAPVRESHVPRRAPIDAVFASVRDLVLPGLRTAIDQLPATIAPVAGYHFGWYDENGRPATGTPGKLLRPALALLSGQAVGGSLYRAVDAAVAVELVHNFSLVHDDLMDGDRTRRHRQTVWSRFGAPTAILAGDALLVLAMQVLASTPGSMATLCTAVQDLIQGQGLDMSFEDREDVSVAECLEMAGGKTATLLACACELGAVHGGGTPVQVDALRRFGWHLGIAFQLVDDLLGIWGDPAVTGKPSRSDLRARKKSLPVVVALAAGGAASRRLRQLYLRRGELSERHLVTAAALVEEAGGRAWAQAEADRHIGLAIDWLAIAEPAARAHEALLAVAALVTRRDH
jgi:geranylgeranyl diphosphate synthase type I